MALQLQTCCKLAQSIGKMVVQVKMKPLSMSAPSVKYIRRQQAIKTLHFINKD